MSRVVADLRGVVEHEGHCVGWVQPQGKRWGAYYVGASKPVRRYKSRAKAEALLLREAAAAPRRPWHAVTLRECGGFVAQAFGLVACAAMAVVFALTVVAGVIAAAFWAWMLVYAVLSVV